MKKILDNIIIKKIINLIIKYKKVFIIFAIIIIVSLGIIINNNDKTIINNKIAGNDKSMGYVIDINGEIKNPGIYSLYEEKYLFEIILLSGGFTDYANIENLNLLQVINSNTSINITNSKEKNDNKINIIEYKTNNNSYLYLGRINGKINIYKVNKYNTYQEIFWAFNIENNYGVEISKKIDCDTYLINSNNTSKVCLNTISAIELSNISNVSINTANKIIEYRDTNGPFSSIEDIMNISGIGTSTFNKLKNYIYIN